MKKNLFKQAKKSLSLFLAVVMLMSCWVWVAPEKADAAKFTPLTQYTVKVKWQLVDRKGKYTGGNIKYKTLGDGWGSESGEQTAVSSLGDCLTNNKSYEKSWTTTSFPTVIMVSYEGGNTEWGAATQDANKARCEVTEILINDKTVWKGNSGYNGANTATFYPDYNAGNDGTSGSGGGTFTWSRPMLAGFNDDTASASDIAVSLNAIGGQDITKTADYNIAKYDCYNQYGVKIADPTSYINNGKVCTITEQTTYVSGTKNSDDPLTGEDAADIYATANDKDTVVIKPNLQISNPQGSDGSATYYLVRKYTLDDKFGGSITSKVSAAVNVTYPKYTVTFNGGVSTAKITADKEYTGSYAAQGYHGTNITVPSKTAADGYTFYEYWSKPQPATGAASYNAAATDFAKPCSSEDYASYLADGGKEENGIVTDKDGGKWYDAGKMLDPTSAKTIDVSENKANFVEKWYAWWLAKDLSVKFYDVDGTFLGEKLVKSGQTQKDITWPTSKYINSGYTTGAFKFKVDPDIWETTNGTEINKNSYKFTTDLILTPKLTRESFKSEYTVTFIHPNNGGSVAVGTEGTYDYRADIKNYADIAKGKIPAVPAAVDGDLQYRYELLGWTSIEPTTDANYHILLEEADFDVNGTSIGLNSDWIVRNDATYYAVYRRYTKTYVVDFNFKDATGADATRQVKFKYGEKLIAPTDYVPYNYVTKGFGYTFANWEYTNAKGVKATFAYKDELVFTSENIEIAEAALEGSDPLEPIEVKAAYGAPVATPYTVTFNYVNDEGEDVSSSATVKNEEFILQETVNGLAPAEKWDDGESLYTYKNQWEITEGAATVGIDGEEKRVGDKINTAELTTLTPTSNISFKAVYADPVPYYTVTYIDGLNTFTDRVLQGSNVPEWTYKEKDENGVEQDKIYVPADYEGEGGTYVFQGWYDEKQTDAEYKTTNGTKVTTADKVTSDLTLYSQFKFVPDKFLIKFMNHDGSVQLGAGEYEKGQNIEALVTTATKAAQGRAKDDTYEYVFLGWDKAVPTFCEGYDVTYTALYKAVYRYYDVKWYNSKLVDGKWVADKTTETVDGKEVEKYLLSTTHHTFNSKLYTPSVSNLTCLEEAEEGHTYTFAGWYYNDAEGNAVKYERGMTVVPGMEFYATYTLSAKVHTVITVVKGETTRYSIADGNDASAIPDPQAGYVNATKHDAFAGWYTDEECTTEFDETASITSDIKIYAKFTESDHNFTEKELNKAPGYHAEGENFVWCACDRSKTEKTESIAKLTDKEIPTGTIYLGSLGKWSSTDLIGGAALDNGEITIHANADTDVIITANDTGDVHALYNPSGLGIGVKYIRAFIYPGKFETLTADSYGAAQQLTTDVYVDETTAATNNANFAVKLGDFVVADLDADGKPQYDENNKLKYKKLENGESYIIYYYVVDKAGNQLRQKVRTAKFIYDDTDPEFTVEGNSNNAAVPTYCGSATVTGVEADAVLTVNGEAVTVTDGKYTINYAEGIDNVIITATDKAGNTYSKKIKVADHNYITDEKAASCGVAGYKKVICSICDDVKTEETYDALAHIYSIREVIPADCVNIGSVVVTCEICGDKVTTQYEEDDVTPVIPALGHAYAKDEKGDIIYTTVTASTCTTAGLGEAFCTACGEGRITKALELDPENHEKVTVSEDSADCTTGGFYKEICICGEVVVEKYFEATGHGATEWYVTLAPTCYQKGSQELRCTVCSNAVEVDGVPVTEEIEATGEHVKVLANPDTYLEDKVVKYKCATEGCPYKYDDKIIEDETVEIFEVSFLDENEAPILDAEGKAVVFEVEAGTSIVKDAVVAPVKNDSADGKFKYSFAGWVEVITEDGKVSYGDTYKLPLTVNRDMVLKASYKESTITYTHQFMVQNTWNEVTREENTYNEYKVLVGAIGEERVPSGTPVFVHKDAEEDARLKSLYTYKFRCWTDVYGNEVTDFTVAGDATFYAKFDRESIEHSVIYYSGKEYLATETVNAGASASCKPVDAEGNAIIPEKANDDTHHYEFSKKWYTDSACTAEYTGAAVKGTLRLYAGFTATEHTLAIDTSKGENGVIKAATCTEDAVIAVKCTAENCKYAIETEYAVVDGKLTENLYAEALGHDKYKVDENGDYVLEDGAKVENYVIETIDGVVYKVLKCSRCGEELGKDEVSVTITFKLENGEKNVVLKLAVDSAIEYAEKPEKAADAEFTYEFLGWYLEGDEDKTIVTDFGTATADKTFVALYEKETRKYNVSYLEADFKTVIKTEEVKYGEVIPSAPADPVKAPTENAHFTFEGWSVAEGTIVTNDISILPEFKAKDHEFEKTGESAGATCDKPGGEIYKCTVCGLEKNAGGTPALGHKFKKVIENVPATYESDGYIIKKCENCENTQTTIIPKRQHKYINVTVKDDKGNLVDDAKVDLFRNDNGSWIWVEAKMSKNGSVVFEVGDEDYKYKVLITGVEGLEKNEFEITGGGSIESGSNNGSDSGSGNSCGCSCHRAGFWGIVFRFFHKVISWFTGRIGCCSCPDEAY